MSTLTEFLLDRIAEDEIRTLSMSCHCDDAEGVQLADCPDRVLAECRAKRQVIGESEVYVRAYESEHSRTDARTADRVASRARSWRDQILRSLAMPYAGHPDYREEWRL